MRNNANFDEKRTKGLCLWCEDQYVPHHRCIQEELLLIVISEIEEDFLDETIRVEELEEENPPLTMLVPSGVTANVYKIMGAIVYAKRKPFHFLIDTDDGNNMAYMAMLKKMRLERLTAGYRQHNSKISYSQVSNSQPRGQGLF